MKILFIYPQTKKTNGDSSYLNKSKISSLLIDFSENLTFPTLAAITNPEHNIKMIDLRYEKINYSYDCDIIGISITTPAAPIAYQIADEFRRRGKTVVLGGWHPSALPEEAKQHADAVVIGEAEETWPQLLKDYEQNKIKKFYRQTKPSIITNLPIANRDILKNDKIEKYLKDARVQASRGCPNKCKFCAITNSVYGNIFRTRDIDIVIEEIKKIPQEILRFCDPSLTINPTFTKKLFKKMIGLNKRFFCNGNVNVLAKDEELLKIASEAGCIGWFVGFDSISQKAIEETGKKTNQVENYYKTIKKIHEYNMMVDGNFIFGFDTDKKDIFDLTLNFIDRAEIDSSDFYILTPYPGTPYFNKFEREKRIITKDWSKYTNEDVVFQPKNMTPDELYTGTQNVKKYYNLTSKKFERNMKKIKVIGPPLTIKFLTRSMISLIRYKSK